MMRIATFNLESLDFQPKASVPLEQRIDILRPQLERVNADILCLQEVNGQKQSGEKGRALLALEKLLEGTVYENFHRIATSDPDNDGVADVHNLVTLSRFPIKSHEEIHHQLIEPISYKYSTALPKDESTHSIKWDRPFLLTTLELPQGKALTVINVHFRAPLASPVEGQKEAPFVWKSVAGWAEGFFVSAIKRAGQAVELRMRLDALEDQEPNGLILVCGDFNAEDHETALRLVTGAEEDTGNGALATHMLIPLGRSVAQDRRYSVIHHGRPQMPDHILVSRALMGHFKKLEIHNETLEDELVGYAKVDHPPDSYHAPVVAEFDLQDVDWGQA